MTEKKVVIFSNQQDLTVDLGILALLEQGIPYLRISTELQGCAIQHDGSKTLLAIGGHELDPRTIESVWLRKPNYWAATTPFQQEHKDFVYEEVKFSWLNLYHLLEDCRWVNPPLMNQRANHRLYVLEKARQVGLQVPPTLVTADPQSLRGFFEAHQSIVAKSVGPGFRSEDGKASFTTLITRAADLPETLSGVPTLFQRFIAKKHDVRVTVFGHEVFAVRIDSQGHASSQVDFRQAETVLPMEPFQLPEAVHGGLLNLMERLGLSFAAIDLLEDHHGDFWFLEVNPNGQWGWIEQDIGLPLSAALGRLLWPKR